MFICALVLGLRASHGTLTELEVDLTRRSKRVAHEHVAKVSHAARRVLVKVDGRAPSSGRYEITVPRSPGARRRRIAIR
jgi:hypothetical protein